MAHQAHRRVAFSPAHELSEKHALHHTGCRDILTFGYSFAVVFDWEVVHSLVGFPETANRLLDVVGVDVYRTRSHSEKCQPPI